MAYLDEDQSVFSNLIETGLWSDGYCSLYPVVDKQAIVEEIRAARAKAGLLVGKTFLLYSLKMINLILRFMSMGRCHR
jgi:hypothetical protein